MSTFKIASVLALACAMLSFSVPANAYTACYQCTISPTGSTINCTQIKCPL